MQYDDVVPYAALTDAPASVRQRVFGEAEQGSDNSPGAWFNYWRGGTTGGWSDEGIDRLRRCFEAAPAAATIGIGHFMHGRACEVDPSESPLVREAGQFSYFFNANWRDPAEGGRHMGWVDESFAAMEPEAVPAYINYLSEPDKVPASYGGNYAALQSVKSAYDPANVFRLNRNIVPAPSATARKSREKNQLDQC